MRGVSFEKNCGAALVGKGNLVLSTGLIIKIGQRKEFIELRFFER